MLNVLPVVLWTVVTISLLLQYDCPWTKFVESNGTCTNRWLLSWNSNLEDLYWNVVCHTICDTVGLVTARLARLDFGLCLLLAACGKWPWLHGATAGLVGYPEGMPLHRLTGYWCIGQSILHSIAYLVHYYIRGGWLGIWQFCFPFDIAETTTINLNATTSPFQNINRLGLINVYGVVAFFISLMILISGIPWIRKRFYTFFQYSHLPMSMIFILFAALHDLQWLYFGIPGLSEWFIGRVSRLDKLCTNKRCSSRKQAVVRVLSETSGPWVELKIPLSKISSQDLITGSRSQWASLRIVELDHEFHPVSLVRTSSHLIAWVTASGGDWSSALAVLAKGCSNIEVEIRGIFPEGGASSFSCDDATLLLFAGGTGISTFFPILNSKINGRRRCHLIWCVKKEEDYLALAGLLPPESTKTAIQISVYVTRSKSTINAVALDKAVDDYRGIILGLDKPRVKEMCVHSLLSVISLSSTIVGLLVCYFCWQTRVSYDKIWIKTLYLESTFKYGIAFRLFPIILILLSMLLVSIIGQCMWDIVRKHTLRYDHNQQRELLLRPINHELDGDDEESTAHNGEDSTETHPQHNIHSGRPNLSDLIREEMDRLDSDGRLVVAAQGPPSLVKAVHETVTVIKESRSLCSRVEWFGVEGNW